jgi:uncharacterized iron-regulated protein
MKILIFLCSLFSFVSIAQDKLPYRIFDKDGNPSSYAELLKALESADIALFGELHNNAIAHWLEYEVAHDIAEKRKLILGAEMIEADNQDALNRYLSGEIDQKAFDTLARLWSNHKTDYKPLVDLAKEKQLDFIACNVPRRYAAMVNKGGFESLDNLSKEDKAWIAPLPIPFDPNLPTYQEILVMLGDHATPDLVKAQALKDATMAYFILENWKKKHLFIHYNGRYHSDFYEGILWYLKQTKSELNYVTITTVEQADIQSLEEENKQTADFIICVDHNMTTTY